MEVDKPLQRVNCFFFTFHPSRSSNPTLLIPHFPRCFPQQESLKRRRLRRGCRRGRGRGFGGGTDGVGSGGSSDEGLEEESKRFLFGGSSHSVSGQLGYNPFMTRLLLGRQQLTMVISTYYMGWSSKCTQNWGSTRHEAGPQKEITLPTPIFQGYVGFTGGNLQKQNGKISCGINRLQLGRRIFGPGNKKNWLLKESVFWMTWLMTSGCCHPKKGGFREREVSQPFFGWEIQRGLKYDQMQLDGWNAGKLCSEISNQVPCKWVTTDALRRILVRWNSMDFSVDVSRSILVFLKVV